MPSPESEATNYAPTQESRWESIRASFRVSFGARANAGPVRNVQSGHLYSTRKAPLLSGSLPIIGTLAAPTGHGGNTKDSSHHQ
jgi:hypothetical protein